MNASCTGCGHTVALCTLTVAAQCTLTVVAQCGAPCASTLCDEER